MRRRTVKKYNKILDKFKNLFKREFDNEPVYNKYIKVSEYLFLISCFQFLKAIILKTFNEIVKAFELVESKTNMLHVNINFTGNLFFGLVDIVAKYSQNLLFLTLFEHLHSQRINFQYFFQVDS